MSDFKKNIYTFMVCPDLSKHISSFQVITLYHPLALRFFLMRTHYKSDVNHSDKALEIASNRVYYIYQVICLDFNIYDFFLFQIEI
jgi:cysteinyl-tRNA synthetase